MKKTSLIFLVDDDPDDVMLFKDAINEIDSSIQIINAANGVDALAKLKEGITLQPDYIFIDLNMPLMNGIQCLQAIKKLPAVSEIPVIIYSTSSYEKDILQTVNNGASQYMVKPFSFQELCDKLRKTFGM